MHIGTIIGIDPGSSNLGFAIITIDLETQCILSTNALTIHGDKSQYFKNLSGNHPDRLTRIKALEEELYQLLMIHQPFIIASESPFYGRFAQAFMVLVEVIDTIRNAILRYDRTMPLVLIDPPSVKNALGAKGAAKKEGVSLALSQLTSLNLLTPLEQLDEHSVDAIGVAYGAYKQYLGMYYGCQI